MTDILDFLKENKLKISIGISLILLIIVVALVSVPIATAEESFTCPNTELKQPEVQVEEYVVDIKGAVQNPGVYRVGKKTIIDEVIELAGGLLENADTSNLNLSKQVTNEMVITVFTKEEIKDLELEREAIQENNDVQINTSLISINNATLEELMTLPGIGESKAKLIISYRETCGPFKSKEELKNIKGIGISIYEQLSEYITL